MKLTDKESETLADLLSRFLGHSVEHSFSCCGNDEWVEEFSIWGEKIDTGYKTIKGLKYSIVLKETGETYVQIWPED